MDTYGADPGDAPPYDAVILAGGRGARLGGVDKPQLTVGGRSLLERTLAACADAARTVVVGPGYPTGRPVRWTREPSPGTGPLPALHAGLAHVTADTVLVLAADLPFLTPDAVRRLRAELAAAPAGTDAALAVRAGRDQPLLAVHRTASLRRALTLLTTGHGRLENLPLRLLTAELAVHRTTAVDAADCDTWQDIAAARAAIREHGRVLEEWTAAVNAELNLDLDVDVQAVLDLARDAAHGVARPAAPLTTFLVGYAAARAGGTPEDIAVAARKAAALADRWAAESQDGPAPGKPPTSH
ncbi:MULTISPECIES: NTP transferase domain-containing protein [Streptomyces]|uniref:NTP transferase domain-containing protein n=1 Tax=Streptomyces TaxID=1883 RepID=UPI0022489964|nr:NTP transferase domain-containing protein [Streptomyces sp. JHD 1]MCX2968055.1 NTP transferase domain-containing protein [Streptomyces sp. JHD 1]